MDNAVALKIVGTLLVAIGSLLLAFRVKEIIAIIIDAIKMHDFAIEQIIEAANKPGKVVVIPTNFSKHVDRLHRAHTVTLVIGFMSICVGSVLNALSAWIGSGTPSP